MLRNGVRIHHLFLILIIFFTSCSSPERRETCALRVQLEEDPHALIPSLASSVIAVSLCNNLYEGLYRIAPDGSPQPALCHSCERSTDGLRYTFHLRDSRWSNGEALTALDFERAWKRVLDPSEESPLAYLLFVVKNARLAKMGDTPLPRVGIQALDERTLQVDLEQPTPYFLQLCAHPLLSPVHARSPWVSNGPFTLCSWKHSNQIEMERNTLFWRRDQVALNKLSFVVVPDPTTALSLYEEGSLDWVGSPLGTLPIDSLPHLKEKGWLSVLPSHAIFWYKFNTKITPFHNAKLRRALSLAIDRRALIDHVSGAPHSPSTGPIPPSLGSKGGKAMLDQPTKARKLLEEALEELNMTKDELPVITIYSGTLEPYRAIAQAIQQQWQSTLSLRVALQSMEMKTMLSRIANSDYMVAGKVWFADFADPAALLSPFEDVAHAANETGWSSPRFREILQAAAVQSDQSQREELLEEAERIFMEECPAACIYHPNFAYLAPSFIADGEMPPGGIVDFSFLQMAKTPPSKVDSTSLSQMDRPQRKCL